jgi:hypothetical protein
MKAYSRRFLESVPFESYSDDFVFDTEILVAAVLGGFRIQEVAIPTQYSRESSSINVRRSLEYIERSIEVCWRASGTRRRQRRREAAAPRTLTISGLRRSALARRGQLAGSALGRDEALGHPAAEPR